METEATVLVVDDEPQICNVLKELLEDEGYRVGTAGDGQRALAEVERAPPDLIISDVMMPGVGGAELVRRLRARGNRVPVVLMSAVYAAVDLPGTAFLPKPFDLDRVLAVVAGLIAPPNTADPGEAPPRAPGRPAATRR